MKYKFGNKKVFGVSSKFKEIVNLSARDCERVYPKMSFTETRLRLGRYFVGGFQRDCFQMSRTFLVRFFQ